MPAPETALPAAPAVVTKPEPAKIEPAKPVLPVSTSKLPSPVKPAPAPAAPAAAVAKPPAKPVAKAVTKPAEKPVAAKPASGKGQSIYVQIGAFSSRDNARALAERAKAAGFSASVASVGGQHRVRVGPYADSRAALAVQARLKDRGFNGILIQP